MPKEFPTPQEKTRQDRERRALQEAARSGKSFSYMDDDGCEVTVTPGGHSFYNAADWW